MTNLNYEVELDVRFRDMDAMGHVNNAVYATYLEQARVRYVEDVVGEPMMETGGVVANLELDFKTPVDWGETVTVGVGATDLGRSSIPLEYEIWSNGDLAATGRTLMVTYDREAGESQPMPDSWREAIAAHEGL